MTHILIPQVEDLDPVVFARRRMHAVDEALSDLPNPWDGPPLSQAWPVGRVVAAVVVVVALVLAMMLTIGAGEVSPAPMPAESGFVVAGVWG